MDEQNVERVKEEESKEVDLVQFQGRAVIGLSSQLTTITINDFC